MPDLSFEDFAVIALTCGPARMTAGQFAKRVTYGEEPTTDVLLDVYGGEANLRVGQAKTAVEMWLERHGGVAIPCTNALYPANLASVYRHPPVIFCKGTLAGATTEKAVSIVGSRNAGVGELDYTAVLSQVVGGLGYAIVSGLADGIDAVAHRVALQAGYRTVGIIGTPINQYYPKHNKELQDAVSQRGLLLSQFPPGYEVTRASFPMRNHTMAAYSQVTLVVSANEKSGTRHQVKEALSLGRAVIITRQVAMNTTWGRDLADQAEDTPYIGVLDAPQDLPGVLDRVLGNAILVEAPLACAPC